MEFIVLIWSTDQTQFDKRISQLWSHLVVLNLRSPELVTQFVIVTELLFLFHYCYSWGKIVFYAT